jgi:hypothetical protein
MVRKIWGLFSSSGDQQEQPLCRSTLGLQVGAWLARGTGPAAMADACERLQVQRAILPDKMARPSLRDRVLGRTLADFQAHVPAKITLVNDDGVLTDLMRPTFPAPRGRSAGPVAPNHQQCSSAVHPQCGPGRLLEGGERERQQLPDPVVAGDGRVAQPFDQGAGHLGVDRRH